jgi:acetylornithine deacetylase/succinyl-diaminopimelate desuccinylase-like protein
MTRFLAMGRAVSTMLRKLVCVCCAILLSITVPAFGDTGIPDACLEDLKSADFKALAGSGAGPDGMIYDASALSAHQQLARGVLEELINIDTTDSAGDNTRAAEAVAARFRDLGFPPESIQLLAPSPRKGNLIVRFSGSDARCKPLILLAHLDVVEADRTAWERDPFTFVEADGYLYGRGVSDDKDEAAIHIANLMRLHKEGFRPRRDIVLALTSDEEGGPHNGVKWLLEQHPDVLQGAFALSEGGGGVLLGGERLANEVQATEKLYQTYELTFQSPGGHSSMPPRDNAIVAAGAAMQALDGFRFPLVLNTVTRKFFERSAALNTGRTRWAMEAILASPPDPNAVDFLSEMPFYNASLRTTCVPTKIAGGHAENALPQRVVVTVNCRLLPTESRDYVTQTLAALVGEDVEIVLLPSNDVAAEVSLQEEVMDAIDAVSRSVWPDVPSVPIMGPGGTDGKFLRAAGTPVYGVNGIFIDVEDDRGHASNERIRSRSFYEGLEFSYRLTKVLSQ